ncbi:2-hydroxychromene-2-carboxylate isomerase [Litoribrevibacter euphylliae]|uniref:2-hydroxychromene-2-carboxylate isomerase n=1 Tax=Litoribrevibacter euphylliae TaxID=1834034 RepID=A0ABV7HBQ4_9GAMM
MSKPVEFYFDFGSPTAYLAHCKLNDLAKQYGAELVYEPMLLGAVHKATNNVPPISVPAKGRYMLVQDLPRFIQRYGVEFKMNSHFPINTLKLMRGCYAAKQLGCFDVYVDVMFRALWAKGLNLGDDAIWKETLSSAGLDADAIIALSTDEAIKAELKENTEKAVKKGCFGAPTMFIDDQMYFGQDRLDFVEEQLAER